MYLYPVGHFSFSSPAIDILLVRKVRRSENSVTLRNSCEAPAGWGSHGVGPPRGEAPLRLRPPSGEAPAGWSPRGVRPSWGEAPIAKRRGVWDAVVFVQVITCHTYPGQNLSALCSNRAIITARTLPLGKRPPLTNHPPCLFRPVFDSRNLLYVPVLSLIRVSLFCLGLAQVSFLFCDSYKTISCMACTSFCFVHDSRKSLFCRRLA